ncbi:MAG: hypothetical protein JXA74_14310 [Anaerolineae bacterium]|nr:hypothetical protein [Anaerolineae bacterium]
MSGNVHQKLALKGVKARVHRTYFEDGLFEITVGLCFLVGFLSRWTTALSWLAPVLIGIGLPAAKKRIAGPRVGYVDLGGAFKGDRRKQTVLGLALVAIIVGLVATGWALARAGHLRSTPTLRLGVALFMGLFCGGLFAGLATAYGVRHFWGYAGVFLLCTAALLFVQAPLPVIGTLLMVMGFLMLAVGGGRLVRFLRRYPRPAGAAALRDGADHDV